MPSSSPGSSMTWLVFALMTAVFWGLYGVFLHTGQTGMADAENGRYKAFLLVGIAYFLTAIVAPLVVLLVNGASWSFPARGLTFSLVSGIVGAIGAFCVLLAFGAKGSPAVVMSIVFAGAPIVNAFVAFSMHPPPDGMKSVRIPFYAGVLLAALGGYLVTMYKPSPGKPATPPVQELREATHGGDSN